MIEQRDAVPKLNRRAFSVVPVFEDTAEDRYWQARTVDERLQHMELLRRINYGPRATARLQRVLELTPLSRR